MDNVERIFRTSELWKMSYCKLRGGENNLLLICVGRNDKIEAACWIA